MIQAFTLILACELVGEVITQALNIPMPGPVLGMLILAVILLLRPQTSVMIRNAAQGLLAHLSLLFVPAGVGVVAHLHRLEDDGLALVLAMCGAAFVGLMVTVLVFAALIRLTKNSDEVPYAPK